LPAKPLIGAVEVAGVPRLLVVGGAGSLLVPGGSEAVMAQPDFPDAYKPEAEAGARFLATLREVDDALDWSFLSPSAEFVEGERTGKFRIGADHLLVSNSGRSWISMEDFAIAFLDEFERPAHSRQRFTVGY